MKNFLISCIALGILVPSSFASAGNTGLYLAPKLFYSYQVMDDVKREYRDADGPMSTGLSDENDSTFGGGLAVGYDFQPNFDVPVRTEVEYAIRSRSEADDSYSQTIFPENGDPFVLNHQGSMKFHIQTIFINLYIDFDTGTRFTPYLGGGVGAAFIKAKGSMDISESGTTLYDESSSKTETNFAYNLAAGVGYDFNDNLTLDLGYRYTDFGKAETGENRWDSPSPDAPEFYNFDADLSAHEVLMAIRYTF
jgi:opacity protein-like surface antigen